MRIEDSPVTYLECGFVGANGNPAPLDRFALDGSGCDPRL